MRVYTFISSPYRFEWNDGPYIEVSPIDDPENAFHAIHVWDYELDEPTIDPDSFPARCEQWLLLNTSASDSGDYLR